MKRTVNREQNLFSYMSLEKTIPAVHPLRDIRRTLDEAQPSPSDERDGLYAGQARPSIPAQYLLRAALMSPTPDNVA